MSKKSEEYKDFIIELSGFDTKSAVDTGGVTGSKKVQLNGINYQLKPSIKDAALVRNIKANGTDRENYGEVIASIVSRALTNSDVAREAELVPQVSLVYDENRQRTLVASKYLNNVTGTLNEYAEKQGLTFQGKHVKIASQGPIDNNVLDISGTEKELLRLDLAKAIAISALSGDHDINPGNMMVVKDPEDRERIARIDFGHAFNDLLNAPKMVGGQVRNKGNQILDFLNREEVAHLISADHRESKLWQNYRGIVPSVELVAAFTEIVESTRLEEGLNKSKAAFKTLMDDLNHDSKGNKEVLNHIKNSLIAINNNISESKINLKKVTPHQALDETFKNIRNFYTEGQQQMKDVAKLMDMQIKIDQLILDKKEGKKINKALLQEVKDAYKGLENAKGIGIKGNGISWIKTQSGKENPPFRGSLDKFIQKRSKSLGVKSKGIDDLISKSIGATNEYTAVAKFLEDSVKFYSKQVDPIDKKILEGKFNEIIDKLPKDLQKTPMLNILKENMGNYVDNMNKQLTKAQKDILSNTKTHNLTQVVTYEARNEASMNSKYMKTSKALQKDPTKWFGNALNDTAWKKAAIVCNAIGWKNGAKKCEQRNEEAKAQRVATKLGIDVSKQFNTKVTVTEDSNKDKNLQSSLIPHLDLPGTPVPETKDCLFVASSERKSKASSPQSVTSIVQDIREQVIEKQIQLVKDWANVNNIMDGKGQNVSDLSHVKFNKFLQENKVIADQASNDLALKAKLGEAEIKGYRLVHTLHREEMSTVEWKQDSTTKDSRVNQITKDGVVLCNLEEKTFKQNLTITTYLGEEVNIRSHRIINFQTQLNKGAEGPVDFSMALKDKDGKNIAKSKGLYFTAHYDNVGKLVEVSTPKPIKFLGAGDKAIGYIEHAGEVYILPVTKGNYDKMMKEAQQNKGIGFALTVSIEKKPQAPAKDTVTGLNSHSHKQLENITKNLKNTISTPGKSATTHTKQSKTLPFSPAKRKGIFKL